MCQTVLAEGRNSSNSNRTTNRWFLPKPASSSLPAVKTALIRAFMSSHYWVLQLGDNDSSKFTSAALTVWDFTGNELRELPRIPQFGLRRSRSRKYDERRGRWAFPGVSLTSPSLVETRLLCLVQEWKTQHWISGSSVPSGLRIRFQVGLIHEVVCVSSAARLLTEARPLLVFGSVSRLIRIHVTGVWWGGMLAEDINPTPTPVNKTETQKSPGPDTSLCQRPSRIWSL